jgi:hypothetical protein
MRFGRLSGLFLKHTDTTFQYLYLKVPRMQKSPLTNTEIAKLQAEISDLKDKFPVQTLG